MGILHVLASGRSGRDHYEARYADGLDRQAEWLARNAKQKADSVELLLGRNGIRPARLLELGCGTGAILQELQRRNVAGRYYGVDYSAGAIGYLKSTQPDVECAVADITAGVQLFGGKNFDVILCSHVLEHLEDPLAFLRLIRGFRFNYLLVEVPLENLAFGKLKVRFVDRGEHPAGHVQFFSRCSLLELMDAAGFAVRDARLYAPVLDRATLRFAYGGSSTGRHARKLITEHFGPRLVPRLWSRWYHAHYAVLCQGKGRQVGQ